MKMLTRIFLTLFCSGLILMTLWVSETAFFGDNVWRDMRFLRKGQAIKFERDLCGGYNFRERALLYGRSFPNEKEICGRLNFHKKSLEVSTGEVLYVGNDPNFFPSSEAEREAIELDESFQSNHPITYKMQKSYKENVFDIWIIIGVLFAVYLCWRLLKLIVRELFFTASKAIEDAKNRNHGER
jgi:hypothetical protein